MADWTIPFRSRAEIGYEIVISGMSDTRTLTGGVPPLVIDEDDSDDFFEPVRTQTGNLTFWDNTGSTWSLLASTTAGQHKVTLYRIGANNTRTLTWQGYLSPNSYTGSLTPTPRNYTFNVYCPLQYSEGLFLDYDASGDHGFLDDSYYGRIAPSVAWYLYKILLMSGGVWDRIYIQTGGLYMEWMNLRLNYGIFFDDDHQPRYNNLELLRYICLFYGWQLHVRGSYIYLLSPLDTDTRNEDVEYFTMAELEQIAKYNIDPQPHYEAFGGVIALEDYEGYFASTSQTLTLRPGWSRCKITSSVKKVDSILGFPDKSITDAARDLTIYGGMYLGDGWYYYKVLGTAGEVYATETAELDILYSHPFFNASIEIRDLSPNTEYSTPPKRNYNWQSPNLLLLYGTQSQATPLFRLRSLLGYGFDSGIFVISADIWEDHFTSHDTLDVYPAAGTLFAKFRVGDKWWDGSAWTSTETIFGIPTGTEDPSTTTGKGKILNTRNLNDPYPAFDGYGIPVSNTALSGWVELTICNVQVNHSHGGANLSGVRMNNVKVEFLQSNSSELYNDEDENVAEVSSGSTFNDEKTYDIPFTAYKNNAFGSAIAMLGNNGYCSALHYGQTSENPNEHVANIIAGFGSTCRLCAEVELFASVLPEFTPMDMMEAGGKTYCVMSRKWNWDDDKINIKAIEI